MVTLNVSDIQHCTVGDGPGIRTTLFLKGCNLHCPWCHNPETISPNPVTLHFPNTDKVINYGRFMTVEALLEELLEDRDFYEASGGGVTVSGGEPLLQAEGVAVLAQALKREGICTLLDTAGCVPLSRLESVAPFIDLYYFDWKAPDAERYGSAVGGNWERIRENLHYLLKAGKDVHVRIPLIPDFNTSPSDCERICDQLRSLGVKQVDLLPFHRLGSSKYEAMGLDYAYRHQSPLDTDTVSEIADRYRRFFTVTVEK